MKTGKEGDTSLKNFIMGLYLQGLGFIFWDLNFRESINIKKSKYMDNGVYKHLVWNYDDLVHMYKDNTAGSRYFCESLFWASQPKQAVKT